MYKDNTWEGQTIRDAISGLRKDYALDKVVVVAGCGMLSRENREWIEQANELLSEHRHGSFQYYSFSQGHAEHIVVGALRHQFAGT